MGVELALRSQHAVRAFGRIAAIWQRRTVQGDCGLDLAADYKLLDKVVKEVERHEKRRPTRETGTATLESGERAWVVTLSRRVADLLRKRKEAGKVRLTAGLLDELHEEVTRAGYDVSRAYVEKQVTHALKTRFRKEKGIPEDIITRCKGPKDCAMFLVGALNLAPDTNKSTQWMLDAVYDDETSPRSISYRELARFFLVCLNVPRSMLDPLAELIEKIHNGHAKWDRDLLKRVTEASRRESVSRGRRPGAAYHAPKTREPDDD